MHIVIDPTRKIQSVQDDFQRHYPYLKIEFYSKAHQPGQGSLQKFQLRHDLTIGQAQDHPKNGVISITPDMKVKDVETIFEDILELHVQIFRLSGKVWLQTISTDHLTLAEQNKMALEMDTPVLKDEAEDYHEQK
jgi:hypothetical protein